MTTSMRTELDSTQDAALALRASSEWPHEKHPHAAHRRGPSRASAPVRRYYAAMGGALACALVAITVVDHLMGPGNASTPAIWMVALLGLGAATASLTLARYAFRLDGELASATAHVREMTSDDGSGPGA